jgi:hypothetical protein
MKKKSRPIKAGSYKKFYNWQFDSTEFLLLAFVATVLVAFFAWQTGVLSGTSSTVLGVFTSR